MRAEAEGQVADLAIWGGGDYEVHAGAAVHVASSGPRHPQPNRVGHFSGALLHAVSSAASSSFFCSLSCCAIHASFSSSCGTAAAVAPFVEYSRREAFPEAAHMAAHFEHVVRMNEELRRGAPFGLPAGLQILSAHHIRLKGFVREKSRDAVDHVFHQA